MGRINPSAAAAGLKSHLTLADYREVAQQSGARQTVCLDSHNAAKLNTDRDSLSARVVRFFRSIAEALHLSGPTATGKRQQLAARQFQKLIRQSGHSLLDGAQRKKTYRHADVIRVLNQTELQAKKAEMAMRAACELRPPEEQVQTFAETVKRQTGHDIRDLIGLSPELDNNEMAKTARNSDLWMKYQSHLDVIAKSQASPLGDKGLNQACQAAARLVVATSCPSSQLDASSRAYRQSVQELTGMLRQCAEPPEHANIAGMVYGLKNCFHELEAGLKGQAVDEREKQMMLDVVLDESLNQLSSGEKNKLFAALRAGGDNLTILRHGLASAPATDQSPLKNIVSALQRNSQTYVYMPESDHREQAEPPKELADKVAVAKQALSDYASVERDRQNLRQAPITGATTASDRAKSRRSPAGKTLQAAKERGAPQDQPKARSLRQLREDRKAAQQQAHKEKILSGIKDLRDQIHADRASDRAKRDEFAADMEAARRERHQQYEQFEKKLEKKAGELLKSHPNQGSSK